MAREAVRKSLVLLKNGKSINESLLPLPKKARNILVAGSHADNLGYQCGGWTIEWQGDSGNITVGVYPLISFFVFFLWFLCFSAILLICIFLKKLNIYHIAEAPGGYLNQLPV